MKNNKHWVNDNGTLYYGSIPTVSDELPVGIYELNQTMTGFCLRTISDSFVIEGKTYGIESAFIERVLTANKSLNKNFGILLKGLKGTGKTITSKLICQKLGLPVILINNSFEGMGEFINSINQDVVLFFDEFEKVYNLSNYYGDDDDDAKNQKGVNGLLTLMDGVFTSDYKRIFLMTTNKVFLPDALLSRPSRIRYIKDFTDLNSDAIKEILTDLVENKEMIPDLVAFLSTLEYITIDVIKTLAEEANIFGVIDDNFLEILNVTKAKKTTDLYKVDGQEEKLIQENFTYNINSLYEGQNIVINKQYYVLKEVDLENSALIVTKKDNNNSKPIRMIIKDRNAVHRSMQHLAF